MSTYGCVLIGRNDNYGGNLVERATYVLNSAILTYDEIIYVDYNSRDKTLFEEVKDNLLSTDKLRCIIVSPEFHREHTIGYINPQPCSEVLGRNIGLRRLSTDFLISTNIDEIQPPREYIESFTDKDKMITVARHGTTLQHIQSIGSYWEIEKIWEYLLNNDYPQSWHMKMTPEDIWSKIGWCGDLQMAHRDLWYEVKGFEEWQLGSGIHDSYLQRKIMESGKDVEVSFIIPIWHLDHHKSSDYNEPSNPNSLDALGKDFIGILNTDNWGFPDEEFKVL